MHGLTHPRTLWAAAAAAPLLLAVLMALPATSTPALLGDNRLGVHLLLEMFAIIIGTLVVVASRHTFEGSRQSSNPVLVTGFTVVVACDLMHALAYEGMPRLISASSTPQAIFFWLAGRTAEVLTMALVACDRPCRTRVRGAGPLGGAIALLLVWLGTSHLELFPSTFEVGRGVTEFKRNYEYVLCAANIAVAAALLRRPEWRQQPGRRLLALSSFVMGVGELAFTSYTAPSDIQNILGHLYKVAAYGLLFRVVFVDQIRAPYEALQVSEARLRESEARLHMLGRNLPLCVVFQLAAEADGTRRFVFLGDALERVSGLRVADVLADAERVFNRVHADDRPALAAAFLWSRQQGTVLDAKLRLVRTDGALRRMHLVAAPRPLPEGRLVWDGTLTDITEQEQADDARRALEADLRQARKMESLGTLASGIAHDFNSVIAAILGQARMAREDLGQRAWDDADRSLQQIEKAANRARALARQILAFGRRQAPQRTLLPLQAAVSDALDLLRATRPAAVQIEAHLEGPPAPVLADTTQVAQVVINLCTNAWQAMGPGGGRIVVAVTSAELSHDDTLALGLPAGRFACLSVSDDGPGMDEATRRRVFEPFFTTKPAGQGTGLGLSVVQGIVAQHDGAVRVESAPGRGTAFRIYLPWQAGTPDVTAAPPPAPRAGTLRGRVLYVDDDETVLLMVERLLTRRGLAVQAFQEPASALRALQAAPAAYDVVVSDFNMPGLSGLELARAVAAIDPLLPFVLVSATVPEHATLRTSGGVVFDVVDKQHLMDELEIVLERALVSRTETTALP